MRKKLFVASSKTYTLQAETEGAIDDAYMIFISDDPANSKVMTHAVFTGAPFGSY